MLSLEELISGCQTNNRKAQKEVYEKYAPLLLGICVRYAKDSSEAEDVLQEGFIKHEYESYTVLNTLRGLFLINDFLV